jgi:hypothetical protein
MQHRQHSEDVALEGEVARNVGAREPELAW